jgi:hypothetical protein
MSDGHWQRFVEWAGRDRMRVGASLSRVVGGIAILIEYLLNYAQRHYFFGPDGLWPWDVFAAHATGTPAFSVYAWSRSPIYFEVCFHLGILVSVLWLVGWRTRWMTPLCFVFWWSMHQRFPSLWDGGDNLMRLALLYAMFADVGAYFSVDAQRRARLPPRPEWQRQALSMLHNAALLAFAMQISLVYGVAGLYKVQGEPWREGTALYYAMRGGQFVWPGVSDLFYQNAYLMTALSYGTVAFQIAFPFLLLMNRYTRLFAVCIGVSFHIGICLFLGLVTFSLFMMAVDLALIGDEEYLAAGRWWARVSAKLRARWPSASFPSAVPPTTKGEVR